MILYLCSLALSFVINFLFVILFPSFSTLWSALCPFAQSSFLNIILSYLSKKKKKKKKGDGVRNKSGDAILDFAICDFILKNSWLKKRNSHLITFKSGTNLSQLDFILTQKSLY